MGKFSRVFAVVLPLGVLIAGNMQADAFTMTQTSNQSVNGGVITACGDDGGAATAPGTPVGPYPCNNQFNEQWIWSNGYLLGLGTANGANNCLSVVQGNPTQNGALVGLSPCAGAATAWNLTYGGIVNAVSSNCLDSQGQIGGGLALVTNNCTYTGTQQWSLKGVTITQTSSQTVNGGIITVCADVGGGATADGTPVGPYPCNNQLNEQWIWSNGQIIGLGTYNGTSKCLTAAGGTPGALVALDTCKPGDLFQSWQAVSNAFNGGNPGYILNLGAPGSSLCLDSLGRVGAGLQLVVNNCNNSAGQTWSLK